MSLISVENLTFAYDGTYDNIFEDVSFSIDTNWKLGFVGRNGKGKTTFLKLLMNQYEYKGKISSSVLFDYFPFAVKNDNLDAYSIAADIYPDIEEWRLNKEVSLLNLDQEILTRPFNTLSKGQQSQILLAILFSKRNNFLLIDEPTNHLDLEARKAVSQYLNNKKGFILVSHDRSFLDSCVDHILSINRANIEVQKGNFSSWYENKGRQDKSELAENNKLEQEITRLKISAKNTADWAKKGVRKTHRDGSPDSRLLTFKGAHERSAAKLDRAAKRLVASTEKSIEKKSRLLKNIDTAEKLKLNQTSNFRRTLVDVVKLSVFYDNRKIFDNISFDVEAGDRVHLKGVNGSGKSSIIKLILGEKIDHTGSISKPNNLKISYISQDTSFLKGSIADFEKHNGLDPTVFRTMLAKLDFSKIQFDKQIENYSEGQKKKLLIAKSLCEQAELYLWDEPLNHIDLISRMQIEDLILQQQPTMIFIEHDATFSKKIATKCLELPNNKNF